MLRRSNKKVFLDPVEGESELVAKSLFQQETTEFAFVDFTSMAGPGLASDIPEGTDVVAGTLYPGPPTRIFIRKIGLRLIVTDETIEDGKEPEATNATRHCKRAIWKTIDVDGGFMFARGWSTSYPIGDGLPMFSASHTLNAGGTFSNTLATPMPPSAQALIVIANAVRKLPGEDGIVNANQRLKRVVCPTEQEYVWKMIQGSTLEPTLGNHARINVVNKYMTLEEPLGNPFWDNTTTNYCVETNHVDRPQLIWRRKPRMAKWNENANETMSTQMTTRYAFAWLNP